MISFMRLYLWDSFFPHEEHTRIISISCAENLGDQVRRLGRTLDDRNWERTVACSTDSYLWAKT